MSGSRFRWSTVFALGSLVQGVTMLALLPVRSADIVVLVIAANGVGRTLGHIPVGGTLLNELSELGPEHASWHRASFSLGLVLLGPSVAGLTLRAFGPLALLVASGLLVLVVGGIVAVVGEPTPVRAEHATRDLVRTRVSALRSLLTRTALVRAFSIEGFVNAAVTVFGAFLPVLVTAVLGLSAVTASAIVAAEGIAYVATLLAGGGVLTRIGLRGQYVWGSLVTSAGSLVVAAAHQPATLLVGSMALGIGLGTISFATFSVFAAQPEDKGLVFSLFGICMAGFVMVGPAIVGVVGSLFGVRAVIASLAPCFLVLGTALARMVPSAAPLQPRVVEDDI